MSSVQLPVSSILANTAEIIDTCQDLEMEPSNNLESLDVILLTELAALVHIKDYANARHLWRRYSSMEAIVPVGDGAAKSFPLPYFQQLWRALEPLLRIYAQEPGTNTFMTKVYSSLQACIDASGDSDGAVSLKTFCKELISSTRAMVADAIEESFESIKDDQCRKMLGFSSSGDMGDVEMLGTGASFEEYLKTRKWTREEGSDGIWIPYFDPEQSGSGRASSSNDRIEYLTKLIGFMETQRLNA